jgi:hypothetical protein
MKSNLTAAMFAVAVALYAVTPSRADLTIGTCSITHTITTDGVISVPLSRSDITAWNLLLNDGTLTSTLMNDGSVSAVLLDGTGVTATCLLGWRKWKLY